MNDLVHIKDVLRHLRHFAELPDEIQQVIAASALHHHCDAGQVIYVEGEPAESIYILETGWVTATRMTREGREQAMMFLRPVEVFGDFAVLTGTAYPGTVDAVVYVTVLTLVVFLFLRIPFIWQGANFEKGDSKSNRMAGGVAAFLPGLMTLTIQYTMGSTHTWNGINYANTFNTLMTTTGIGLLILGASMMGLIRMNRARIASATRLPDLRG